MGAAVGAGAVDDAGLGPLRLPTYLLDLRYRWEILELMGDEGSRKGPNPTSASTPAPTATITPIPDFGFMGPR
jgi:hypothetical protein